MKTAKEWTVVAVASTMRLSAEEAMDLEQALEPFFASALLDARLAEKADARRAALEERQAETKRLRDALAYARDLFGSIAKTPGLEYLKLDSLTVIESALLDSTTIITNTARCGACRGVERVRSFSGLCDGCWDAGIRPDGHRAKVTP